MSIKIGHASGGEDAEHRVSGGAAGDQTGGEVCIREWYSSPWHVVLRPKNEEMAERSAKACEAACANRHIGYDQGSRNTLYIYSKLVNFDLAAVEDDCECDCSSLMHVCAIAGGAKLPYGYNGMWTGNMEEGFTANGEYEALTDPQYLTSDAHLLRGDILVNRDKHTAMALENGPQTGKGKLATITPVEDCGPTGDVLLETEGTVMLTPLPVIKMGSTGTAVSTMQILLKAQGYDCGEPDGICGEMTDKAIRDFQWVHSLEIDGKCGKLTWARLING